MHTPVKEASLDGPQGFHSLRHVGCYNTALHKMYVKNHQLYLQGSARIYTVVQQNIGCFLALLRPTGFPGVCKQATNFMAIRKRELLSMQHKRNKSDLFL